VRFNGTLLPTFPPIEAGNFSNESENETAKMGLDLLDKINQVSDLIPTVPTTNYGVVMEWQPIITSNLTIGPTSSAASFSTVTIYAGVSVTIVSPARWVIESTVGEIFDFGTNANGSYIKYSSGVMQCWGIFPAGTTSGGGAWGVGPYFYVGAVTLPATYINATYSFTFIAGGGNTVFCGGWVSQTTTAFSALACNNINGAVTSDGKWQSIGFWR